MEGSIGGAWIGARFILDHLRLSPGAVTVHCSMALAAVRGDARTYNLCMLTEPRRKRSRLLSLSLCTAAFFVAGAAQAQAGRPDPAKPSPASQPRPAPATVRAWQARRFGMFIHFGLYSQLGGVWKGRQIDNGYSEQIMANAPIPRDQYAAIAKSFDPEKFDADAIVALAKAAGMKFIVVTAKHHDGFAMFNTRQSDFNIVEATPYHRDVVKQLADACARGGLKFGVYYSTIDWHAPTGSPYVVGNSNPISDAHAAFNAAQLKELLTGYGPLSEIWFDMGKPTPDQSRLFAQTVHRLQPQTMVSGRVFNYQGDFTVMGDNEVPQFAIDEPWQTPASIFGETWGYRSWQKRDDVKAKTEEKILELVKVASRGGNYILNIGPEADGSVVPFEAQVLEGIGQWLKVNREAIFGVKETPPAASPFRNLDFGDATVSRDTLYLFVHHSPKDGVLLLPGVEAGVHFGKPRVLGQAAASPALASTAVASPAVASPAVASTAVASPAAGSTFAGRVTLDQQGAVVSGVDLPAAGFLPVIAIPFTGKLSVRPRSLVLPAADGTLTLTPDHADKFLNYNGQGYEAPATLYKLRWPVASRAGRYQVSVAYKRSAKQEVIELIAGGGHAVISTERGAGAAVWSGEVRLGPAEGSLQVVEITPREPFVKGTPLPVAIESVTLKPLQPEPARQGGRP